jgi:hypothetical protein
MLEVEFFLDHLRHGSFAGTGRTEHDNPALHFH